MKFDKKVLKKLFGLLTMIMFIFTIYKISETYALLHSEISGAITSEVGNWYIKINNVDIVDEVSKDIIVNGVAIDSDTNVKSGKIAPGLQGYFNLIFNTTNTSVSARYDITILEEESILDIVSIKDLNRDTDLIKTGKNIYSGIINLNDIDELTTVQVKILWNNDIETDEKNSADTEIGIQRNANIEIPINVSFSQYLGEELIEYVEEIEEVEEQ